MALHHVQRVAGHVLARHIPGVAIARAAAAQADALALPQRVERQADVLADFLAVRRLHRSRLGRQVAVEEIAERPLADKADAGGILLLGIGQVARQGQHFLVLDDVVGLEDLFNGEVRGPVLQAALAGAAWRRRSLKGSCLRPARAGATATPDILLRF